MPASASSRIGVAIAGCIPTINIETEGPHHGVVAEEPGVSGVNDLEGLGGYVLCARPPLKKFWDTGARAVPPFPF